MAVPADFDAVIESLKLGWYIAEVRGRNRIDDGAPHPPEVGDADTGDALLLRSEQPSKQREATAEGLIAHLARKLVVDAEPGGASWTGAIAAAAQEVRSAGDHGRDDVWKAFAKLVYDFDHAVQQAFAETSDAQSAAYQLGRALAESYWAFDATQQDVAPGSWSFLLGEERCSEVVRLVGRLCPYYTNKYTGPAISGSVEVWQRVASTPGWRDQESAPNDLYQQTRRWYELLVLGQDPTTLVRPGSLLRNFRSGWRTARAFLPQLVFGALSVAVLFGALKLSNTPWATGLGSTLGAVGISLSALTGKMKSEAQALTTRLRDDAYSDLICVEITVVPARTDSDVDPKLGITSPTRRAVTAALGDRKLTTAVSV